MFLFFNFFLLGVFSVSFATDRLCDTTEVSFAPKPYASSIPLDRKSTLAEEVGYTRIFSESFSSVSLAHETNFPKNDVKSCTNTITSSGDAAHSYTSYISEPKIKKANRYFVKQSMKYLILALAYTKDVYGLKTQDSFSFPRRQHLVGITHFSVDRIELLPNRARILGNIGTSRKTFLQSHTFNNGRGSREERENVDYKIERISKSDNHIKHLKHGILKATRSIFITSYGVDDEFLERENLYRLLAGAASRGVKIYIYNGALKPASSNLLSFFNQHPLINYDTTFTHSKIFAVDKNMVSVGSYNWLANDNSWEDASLCLSGTPCSDLISLLWRDLKHYRNYQFENIHGIAEYENNFQNDHIYPYKLDPSTDLAYIHSLKSHRNFIKNILQNASYKIVFCVPFINKDSGYQKDFTKRLLNQALRRNVSIYFICRQNDPNFLEFKHYLGDLLNSELMHFITMPNIHLKTVLVDDQLITEGSFNWLSASRDENSCFHNHEVTLALGGSASKKLIQDFYKSPIGKRLKY